MVPPRWMINLARPGVFPDDELEAVPPPGVNVGGGAP